MALRTLLGLLLYYARKAILLKWKSPSAPTLDYWKHLVNTAIPLYKYTYESRVCPRKFSKVWDIWYDSPSSNASQDPLSDR